MLPPTGQRQWAKLSEQRAVVPSVPLATCLFPPVECWPPHCAPAPAPAKEPMVRRHLDTRVGVALKRGQGCRFFLRISDFDVIPNLQNITTIIPKEKTSHVSFYPCSPIIDILSHLPFHHLSLNLHDSYFAFLSYTRGKLETLSSFITIYFGRYFLRKRTLSYITSVQFSKLGN